MNKYEHFLIGVILNKYTPSVIKRLALSAYKRSISSPSFALRVRRECESTIDVLIRSTYFPDALPSDDKQIDAWVTFSFCHLTGLVPSSKFKDEEIDVAATKAIVASALDRPAIREALADYHTINALLNKEQAKDELADRHLSLGKAMNRNAEIPSTAELFKLWLKYRKSTNRIKRSIQDNIGEKIKLSLSDATQITTLVSVSLIVGSYYVTNSFYYHFGIISSNYFGIADYLSASIDLISSAVLATLLSIFGVGIAILSSSRTPKSVLTERTKELWPELVILCGLISIFIAYFRDDLQMLFSTLPLVVWLIAVRVVPKEIFRFFEAPFFPLFAILFAIYFSVKLYSGTQLELLSIHDGTYWKKHQGKLDISPLSPNEDSELKMIGSNSTYFFCLDNKSGSVVVVPKNRIKAIHY